MGPWLLLFWENVNWFLVDLVVVRFLFKIILHQKHYSIFLPANFYVTNENNCLP